MIVLKKDAIRFFEKNVWFFVVYFCLNLRQLASLGNGETHTSSKLPVSVVTPDTTIAYVCAPECRGSTFEKRRFQCVSNLRSEIVSNAYFLPKIATCNPSLLPHLPLHCRIAQ